MKQLIKIALVILLITAMLSGNVVADDTQSKYYDYAVKLGILGLFRGTGSGFELDRAPTRVEGAVMFVRLMGAEEEALEKNYPHPFEDVPLWSSPYIGYLYHNELTNGITSELFGSKMSMKAVTYLTFALRLLGYSDEGVEKDFSWESALEFAYGKIVVDTDFFIKLSTADFLREDVCKISYAILKADILESGNSLIESLIASGAVKRSDAEAVDLVSQFNMEDIAIEIGHTFEHIINRLGHPQKTWNSRYRFEWKIFDSDYSKYIQVGIENNKVVGVLSASTGYSYEKDVRIGMTRTEMEKAYKTAALTEYKKPVPGENTIKIFSFSDENAAVYRSTKGDYIAYFFDSYTGNRITAILVIDDLIENRTLEIIPEYFGEAHYRSLEYQVHGLTNAFRVQYGLQPLIWDGKTRDVAALHSKDMAKRNYFSHINPEGGTLGDRLNAGNISFNAAGENIARGYRNPVNMVNDWLNSSGHREVLLGDYVNIGVGIWYDSENTMLSTQDYWK